MSKIMMLLLVAMLAMAIGVTALADPPTDPPTDPETTGAPSGFTISIAAGDTHTYDVYQILTGELSSDGTTLSNVSWGSSVNTVTEGKINGKTATEFAKSLEGLTGVDAVTEVSKYFTINAKKVGQVTKDDPLKDQAVGYYVLVDVTALEGDHVNDTQALTILELTNDTKITKKWGTTVDEKTIVSDTLGTEEKTIESDKDNVSVGDTVNYQIETKVPENADLFKPGTFFFVITDNLSEGLTFNKDIKVYKESISEENLLTSGTHYTARYPAAATDAPATANTFEIGLIHAEEYAGKTIIVTYSADLNEKAKIGEAGNPNTSHVEFSNNPNQTYDNTVEKTDEPGFPKDTTTVPTGYTPDSETKTYTTGIEIQKVDENGQVLTGAEFTITGESTEIVLVSSESFEEVTAGTGEYYKLTNNTYTKDPPVTSDKMDAHGKAAAGSTGYVEAEASYDGADKVVIGETAYRPVKDSDAGKDLYILVKKNTDQYVGGAEATAKYKKTVTYTTQDTNSGTTEAKAEVGPDGVVTFTGLGAGTYTIKESKTPDGYNTIPDVKIEIEFDADGDPHWSKKTSENGEFTYDSTSGVFKTTIVNNKGGQLPETGGIGTTIFYIGGSILVLAALILLVTRRRMSAND